MNSDTNAIPVEPPVAGGEVDMLLGELERVRGYIAWKCGGLDPAGLRATLGLYGRDASCLRGRTRCAVPASW